MHIKVFKVVGCVGDNLVFHKVNKIAYGELTSGFILRDMEDLVDNLKTESNY